MKSICTIQIIFFLSFVGTTLLLQDNVRAETFTNSKGVSLDGKVIKADLDAGTVTLYVDKFRKEFDLKIADLNPASQEIVKKWHSDKFPKPAEWVEPGATHNLEFADLGKCNHDGSPLNCNVYVPTNYKPDQPVALLVWLTGGKGGNGLGGAYSLAGKEEFVCASLPYPEFDGRDIFERQKDGGLADFWEVHAKMLSEIHKAIPNIDPKVRVIAGFSNGAHSIAGYCNQVEDEIAENFNVFVFGDGGTYEGSWSAKNFRDAHSYCCWGETSTNKNMTELTAEICDKARMIVTKSEMADTGHKFTPEEKTKVQNWLLKQVLVERRKPAE